MLLGRGNWTLQKCFDGFGIHETHEMSFDLQFNDTIICEMDRRLIVER